MPVSLHDIREGDAPADCRGAPRDGRTSGHAGGRQEVADTHRGATRVLQGQGRHRQGQVPDRAARILRRSRENRQKRGHRDDQGGEDSCCLNSVGQCRAAP